MGTGKNKKSTFFFFFSFFLVSSLLYVIMSSFMAKGNILLGTLRGRLGDTIFQRYAGYQRVSSYNNSPRDAGSLNQYIRRARVSFATQAFRHMSRHNIFKYFGDCSTEHEAFKKFMLVNLKNFPVSLYSVSKIEREIRCPLSNYFVTYGSLPSPRLERYEYNLNGSVSFDINYWIYGFSTYTLSRVLGYNPFLTGTTFDLTYDIFFKAYCLEHGLPPYTQLVFHYAPGRMAFASETYEEPDPLKLGVTDPSVGDAVGYPMWYTYPYFIYLGDRNSPYGNHVFFHFHRESSDSNVPWLWDDNTLRLPVDHNLGCSLIPQITASNGSYFFRLYCYFHIDNSSSYIVEYPYLETHIIPFFSFFHFNNEKIPYLYSASKYDYYKCNLYLGPIERPLNMNYINSFGYMVYGFENSWKNKIFS